jgi:hypothetical protein
LRARRRAPDPAPAEALTTSEPADVEKMDDEYRRDMDRFATDRDAKIRRIREGAR